MLFVTVAATLAGAAHAADPARISHLVDKSLLNERERGEIRRYSDFWGQALDSEKPGEVDKARERLGQPLSAVRVGDVFRFEYSKAVVKHLDTVVNDGSPHAATNAMLILSLLGTPSSLEVMLDHASIEDEPDFGIRLTAANGFPIAVSQDALPNMEINKALRDLGEAAASEARAAAAAAGDDQVSWLVLRRQFEAINSVKSHTSREVQIKVMKAATEAMEAREGPSKLMQATYRALMLIRNEYLRLPQAEQETVGKSLAPVLCDLCTVAAAHWDNAQQDETARKTYGNAVRMSERLLKMIDSQIRPNQAVPRTELGPAWQDRKKNQFTNDHDTWRTLLLDPPYNKPR